MSKRFRVLAVLMVIVVVVCGAVPAFSAAKRKGRKKAQAAGGDAQFQATLNQARQGNSKAQYTIGNMYYNGYKVKKNYAEAVKWYKQAAEKGHVQAQMSLGSAYMYGTGVNKDYVEARKWLQMSAEKGNVVAQSRLGDLYYEGWYDTYIYDKLGRAHKVKAGFVPSYVHAIMWWQRAAGQGYADAQYKIGNMYYRGEEVEQSYSEAMYWWRKAAKQGHTDAQKKLRDLGVTW